MKRFGKEGSFFVPLVVFGAIITLISILGILYIKADRLEGTDNEAIGEKQTKLFTVYQIGEKYLHFVDESAKLSVRPALLEVSRNGLKNRPDDCGKDSSQQYTMWAKDSTDPDCNIVPKTCYPTEDEDKERSYFVDSFKSQYLPLLQEFNDKKSDYTDFSAKIPYEFADLKVENADDNLELVGTAKDPITLERFAAKALYNLVINYSVKPSFRIGIDVNFLKDVAEMAAKAPQLVRKKEDEIRSALGDFNSQNPELQWKLASYLTPSTSCPHTIGTCTYDCNCVTVEYPCEEDSEETCTREDCETCTGSDVETVTYDDFNAVFSVTDGKSFYVSDPPSGQPQLKSLEYDFGLSWLEETGRDTACVP